MSKGGQKIYISNKLFATFIWKYKNRSGLSTGKKTNSVRAFNPNPRMLQYMLFHAAPDINWFLRLISHRCAKVVVDWGGVHYFRRNFTIQTTTVQEIAFV